jgi:hypothetical protein
LFRYFRLQDRQKKKKDYDVTETLLDLRTLFEEPTIMKNLSEGAHDNHQCTFTLRGKFECGKEDEPCQASDLMIMDKMRSAFQRLTTENIALKAKVSVVKLTPESLKDKEEKVKYLTGLPGYLTLMQVFQLLEPFVQESTRSTLSQFEKLMLVLMKLILNLPLQDIASDET